MRKQITPKKRFQVLERDDFRCRYCWRGSSTTVLEVDHIIPVKKWWTNKVDNLVTSCHRCNRWKWSNKIWENKTPYWDIIRDWIAEAKKYFYRNWNKNFMWMVDKKTQVLFAMFTHNFFNDYHRCLNHPAIWWKWRESVDRGKADIEFQNWWKFCESVVSELIDHYNSQHSDYTIEYVFDDSNWKWYRDKDYSNKLNFLLLEEMYEQYKEEGKLYVLHKYSLHHHLLNEIQ